MMLRSWYRGKLFVTLFLIISTAVVVKARPKRTVVQEAGEKTGSKKSLDIFIDTGLPLKDEPLLVSQFSNKENDLEQGKAIHDNNLGPAASDKKSNENPKTEDKSSVYSQQQGTLTGQEQALKGKETNVQPEVPQQFIEKQQASDNSDERNAEDAALQEALIEHNRFRKAHGVPSVQWNVTLADRAQEIADNIAENPRSFKQEIPGENVAQIWHDFPMAPKKASDIWYSEESKFSFSYPQYSDSVRHFVQMVWRSTRMMGMGFASSPTGKYVIVVALYSPVASDLHVLRKNVLRPGVVKDVYATLKHRISRPHKTRAARGSLDGVPTDL